MSKTTQRWEWAIGLKFEELNEQHLQAAYKLNWDNLCKFDNCRKNCKRTLCLACFDRSWIDNDNLNNSGFDHYDTTNCEQKRADLKSFVGLKNLGATCYVNCLLQLWFHNPALRKAIYEWESNNDIEKHQQKSTVQAIKMIQSSKDSDNSNKTTATPSSPANKEASKRAGDYEAGDSTPSKKRSKTFNNNNGQLPISPSKLSLPSTTTAATTTTTTTTTTTSPVTTIATRADHQLQTSPIEQLQLIFARLQFTNKKSIDPFNFIDSLALNAAEQQDAQEFGNLFMEFLEKSFANQNNSFVSKIIQTQFCGRYSYATICDTCKHSSLSDSNFYELDLSIQNLETLHDCLNEFFRPVPLDGKYNCSHCDKAQSAHRKIILKSLPPTLNLQLLRFVYDIQRNVRQKLNSHIIFPEILDMNLYLKNSARSSSLDLSIRNNNNSLTHASHKSNIYILSAVLIHRGSSPHSGHYIAHIKDRISKDWYKFNDDSVERIGPQLQVSTDGENITIVDDKSETIKSFDPSANRITKLESKSLKSKTAYMLVYQAQDNEALSYPSDHSDSWMLPDHLQTAVLEENSRSEELFESLQIAKEVDLQIVETRKNQIRTIYEKLVCRDPSEKFEFIDKNWLQKWLTNSSSSVKFEPINNSNFLCCHDKLDFRKIDQVKCVRTEGADLLYKEFGGGPRLQEAMCRKCVELEVKLIQLKDRMKEDQKFITSQAKFKLGSDYNFDDAYIVGKNSYRDWQGLVMAQFKKSYPELKNFERDSGNNHNSSDEDEHRADKNQDSNNKSNEDDSDSDSEDEKMEKFVFNSDILCQHDQLIIDTTAWRIVPKEVWEIFKRNFGNDPSRPLIEKNANTIICYECKRKEQEQLEMGGQQKTLAAEQKSQLADLFHNRKRASWCSILPTDTYYALNREFLTKWQKFIRNPCNQAQPTSVDNEKLVCKHGQSLYNIDNSNPILPECPFVLINGEELANLKKFYAVDFEIKFILNKELADSKLRTHVAAQLWELSKVAEGDTNTNPPNSNMKEMCLSGDSRVTTLFKQQPSFYNLMAGFADDVEAVLKQENVDMTEIDWSDCIMSEPHFCQECHEMLKEDELKKLLNYESATIYITKVESPVVHGIRNNQNANHNSVCSANSNLNQAINGGDASDVDCDITVSQAKNVNVNSSDRQENWSDIQMTSEQAASAFRRRKKIYVEDEANDFVPSGATVKTPGSQPAQSNSILRRTTRRNRNREQAYTIKPSQTLLQLKKEIFSRCQVLPSDQRLFLDDILLTDNDKTMAELKIVPNSSLKLEVDRPISDNIDMIEDDSSSRKTSAQPETGFKGSLLLSNSHL